jgi:hypothetical protein
MGNTTSMKTRKHKHSDMRSNLHMHGEVECTRKHGRRAFKNHRYRTRRYKKRGGSPRPRHPLSVSHKLALPRRNSSTQVAARKPKFNEHGTPLAKVATNFKEFGVEGNTHSKEFSTSALPPMVQLTPEEERILDAEIEAEHAAKAAKRKSASTRGGSRKRRRRGPVGKK